MTSLDSISGSLIQTFFREFATHLDQTTMKHGNENTLCINIKKKPEDAKHVLPFLVYLEIVSSFKLLLDSATK